MIAVAFAAQLAQTQRFWRSLPMFPFEVGSASAVPLSRHDGLREEARRGFCSRYSCSTRHQQLLAGSCPHASCDA